MLTTINSSNSTRTDNTKSTIHIIKTKNITSHKGNALHTVSNMTYISSLMNSCYMAIMNTLQNFFNSSFQQQVSSKKSFNTWPNAFRVFLTSTKRSLTPRTPVLL